MRMVIEVEVKTTADLTRLCQAIAPLLLDIKTTPASQEPQQPAADVPVNGDSASMPRCPLHPQEVLRLYAKNGRQWRAHKTADGQWCHGKEKRS
jgi:hypothetical protein